MSGGWYPGATYTVKVTRSPELYVNLSSTSYSCLYEPERVEQLLRERVIDAFPAAVTVEQEPDVRLVRLESWRVGEHGKLFGFRATVRRDDVSRSFRFHRVRVDPAVASSRPGSAQSDHVEHRVPTLAATLPVVCVRRLAAAPDAPTVALLDRCDTCSGDRAHGLITGSLRSMSGCEDLGGWHLVACAIESLQPKWWEQWLPAVATLLSVLVPVLIAIWVSRDARKTTLHSVQVQIEAEREERRRDELRARVVTLSSVTDRQLLVEQDDWRRELWSFSEAIVSVTMALPWGMRETVGKWLRDKRQELIELRAAMRNDPSIDLIKWSSQIRTICEMIHAEASESTIQTILRWMDNPETAPELSDAVGLEPDGTPSPPEPRDDM